MDRPPLVSLTRALVRPSPTLTWLLAVIALVIGLGLGLLITSILAKRRSPPPDRPQAGVVFTAGESENVERETEPEAQSPGELTASDGSGSGDSRAPDGLADAQEVPRDFDEGAAWDLEQLRLSLAMARHAAVSTAPLHQVSTPLASLLAEEVERIREEVGTPGSLEWSGDHQPSKPVALLVFEATRTLLDILNRRMQAFDLQVETSTERVRVAVLCQELEEVEPNWALQRMTGIIVAAGGSMVREGDTYIVELSSP